jgi:hypothetical protein
MVVHQISDPVDAYVCRRIFRYSLGVAGVVTLVHKHGCDALIPDLFDGMQDADFVVERRFARLDSAARSPAAHVPCAQR